MTLLLAAVGATVMALLELTVGPYLRFGTAQPHLVLVIGIVVTVGIGLEAGLVWAFLGGLVVDVLAQRPLGSTAFTLLLCLGQLAHDWRFDGQGFGDRVRQTLPRDQSS